jgi:hypothetical protein
MWQTTLYDTTKLTIELRDIVDNGDNSVDIFDFEYDSFYEGEAKKAFEQKVIDHYYDRQIGFETVGRFLHHFRTRVRELAPYYKKLYELEAQLDKAGDPFQSYDLTETYKQTSKGSESGQSSGSSTNTDDHLRKLSNTPQGSVDNLDDYMTEAEKNTANDTSTSTASSSGSSSGEVEHTLTRKGNIGVQPLGTEFTANWQAYINIDLMFIEALNDLFLGVY